MGKFIDFQQDNDVRIFYLALSASEFEFMSEEERVKITKFISSKISKTSILLAQPLGSGSLHSQIVEAQKMIEAGATALVVKPQGLKENTNFLVVNICQDHTHQKSMMIFFYKLYE